MTMSRDSYGSVANWFETRHIFLVRESMKLSNALQSGPLMWIFEPKSSAPSMTNDN